MKIASLLVLCCLSCHAHAYRVEATTRFSETARITSYGTAAGVSKHELITCWHVVEDAEEIWVSIEGEWRRATMKRADRPNDLALLVVKEKLKYAKLAERAPPQGAVLDMTASDRGQPLTAKVGKVIQEGYANFNSVAEGNSGAPVLHKERIAGILCGIVTGTNTGRYVAADTVRNLLDVDREDTE